MNSRRRIRDDRGSLPVRFAPGRLRLATRPNATGSPAVTKTIGPLALAIGVLGPGRRFCGRRRGLSDGVNRWIGGSSLRMTQSSKRPEYTLTVRVRTIPANEGRRPRRTDALDHRTNAIVGRKPARTHDIRCSAALTGSLRRKEFVAADCLQSRLVSLANSGRAALYLRCRQRVTGAINHETCFMPRSGRFGGTGITAPCAASVRIG